MSEPKVIKLSIEEWDKLFQSGTIIPIQTILYGKSMEPLIRYKKDTVTIVPFSGELRIGDIVLFRRASDGIYVVHRVFSINDNYIQTWGDNCKHPDNPIPRTSILGRVTAMKKNNKYVVLDSDSQREYGVRWMHGCPQKRVWFIYRNTKASLRHTISIIFKTLKKARRCLH